MKDFLTKKHFGGKVPGWLILVVIGGVAFIVMKRRKKNAGADQENPAASASEDSTTPFPYSAPDMFPLQGNSGPAGPPGPAGPRGKPGKNAPGIKPKGTKVKHPAKKTYHPPKKETARVGNRPAYNKRLGTTRIPARLPTGART